MLPEVVEVMQPYYESVYGNPSSLHRPGRQARQAIEAARDSLGSGLNTPPDTLIFTGSGSEADNLALVGVALKNQGRGRHVITSSIEHHAVLHTCHFLETLGFDVTYLPVDAFGLVQPGSLQQALRQDTLLVSIMHANNEIGVIQPIQILAHLAHNAGALFHTDAVQTAGLLPLDIKALEVDLLSISAHKFYGPKGVGALVARSGIALEPLVHGGAQEAGRRAGTENVAGIVGMAKAFELALNRQAQESTRLSRLRDAFWQRLAAQVQDIRLNGHLDQRLPNNLSISIKDVEAEGLVLRLSLLGIYASMGSACNSASIEPSHVIKALKLPVEWERGAVRLSLGIHTTIADVQYAADSIVELVNEMRAR
jgi:cysteine desulfurase